MTFTPAERLPKSYRPPPAPHRLYVCSICNGTVPHSKVRNINRVEGFRHRKLGVACDTCVKRLDDRREANREKMVETRGETFLG